MVGRTPPTSGRMPRSMLYHICRQKPEKGSSSGLGSAKCERFDPFGFQSRTITGGNQRSRLKSTGGEDILRALFAGASK